MPSAPLIRTKLRLPFIRANRVPRPRLHARIAEGIRGLLTLVIAPAGFGKTTLVTAAIAGCGLPVAWLALDRDDNQAGRFLTYLVAALQGADGRVGGEAAQLMLGVQPAPPEAVLTSLVNDLDAAGEMLLVLDDYQFMSSPAVHAAVAFLLEHAPQAFHLVIATRSDPPLPLARLRARGQLVELRAADLRFTPGEAAQFLNDVMRLDLDATSIALLEERTEGWIAGLQMVALSMHDRADVPAFIAGFSGTNRHILDYLLEEILAAQSPEVQHFLLVTSLVERLSAPLCDALLAEGQSSQPGPPASAAILEYLERENIFLVALDDERAWFRYHHLFADLLRARLHQSHPDLIPCLHLRASAWLERNGLISDAIQHLFAAGEMERAADLIERYGPAMWSESDPSVVQMAERLPPAMLIAHPKIGIYAAWLQINLGIIEKALPLLLDLRQGLNATEEKQRWIATLVRLALAFLGWRSRPDALDPLPELAEMDEIPASEPVLRDAADVLYAMTLGRRGELDRAAEFSQRCIQRAKLRQPASNVPAGMPSIPTLVPFLATAYYFQGRLHAAAELCRQYLDPFREKGIRISSAGNLDVILGEVLYEWNRLEEAEDCIRAGLRANRPWGNIMTDAFGLLALAQVLQARGDHAAALQAVDEFETRLQAPTRPHEFTADYHTLRVRVQLGGGDLQAAVDWADQLQHSNDFRLHPENYRLTLAQIRLAQGSYAAVDELLSGVCPEDLAGNRVARQVEVQLLHAVALAGLQRLPEAMALIASCLALAEPEGQVRIFLNAGEPVRDLLAAYLRSPAPAHSSFARKLLAAFSPMGEPGSPAPYLSALVEPLSARELEVLRLMALGKTNQDIARQLVVAGGTIKAHAASIYRKLDVANRTEAVARARQYGLLS